jgi:CRISP-associated protein Cas1
MTEIADDVPTLVPARMVNEFSYCQRLFYLEWVHAVFQGNSDTAEGDWQHRAVDRLTGRMPAPETVEELRRVTSLTLGSKEIGLIATIDTVEGRNGKVVPVDTKKGRPPSDSPAWESDMVQLCVQGMLLREHGYECDEGEIYYAQTRERRTVMLDDELVQRTGELVRQLRVVALAAKAPPPLVDSPKCPRCALVGVCLPDETNHLSSRTETTPRRLVPRVDAARPLYVTEQGAYVGLRDGRATVSLNREVIAEVRMLDVSQVNVHGNIQLSTPLIRECFRREIPILWFSHGGWFVGMAEGLPGKNVDLRRRQAGVALQAGLPIARQMIFGKIRNSRTFLMRNSRQRDTLVIDSLKRLAAQALHAERIESLLGIEGAAARLYFSQFSTMLASEFGFDFTGRNRRPPRDEVNCMLSFAYSLLAKDLTAVTFGVGFDPYLGFLHRPRFGRPALALDLAEEFRPLIAESVVVGAINNGEIKLSDFIKRSEAVALTTDGRRSLIRAYERRLDTEITHPTFGYTISYRRVMEVQARILAAFLLGDVPDYTPFVTR